MLQIGYSLFTRLLISGATDFCVYLDLDLVYFFTTFIPTYELEELY